jgi:aminoglycoside 6'-N-acetyltransferase
VAFTFRSLVGADFERLSGWLRQPHVERWWPDPNDLASVTDKYQPLVDGTDQTRAYICYLGDRPIGYVQAYRLADEPAWQATVAAALGDLDAVGIDYLIGEVDLVGRGNGSAMIEAFVASVWRAYPEVLLVVVAVQQANAASWGALEHAGFTRAWQGRLDTDDPSDQGPAYLYRRERPSATR